MKNEFDIRGEVVAIKVTCRRGNIKETLIDLDDLELVNSINGKWFGAYDKKTKSFYVNRTSTKSDCGKPYSLHRMIMDDPKGYVVDHVNHDTLDNRKSNLRIVTNAQNMQNMNGVTSTNKSGVRGVFFDKRSNKWIARIMLNGKKITIGSYDRLEDAKKAVVKARQKYMPFSYDDCKRVERNSYIQTFLRL